jgi:hypothetical protein
MTDQHGNMDFGEWLMGQQKRKDAVGELARYAKKDKRFRRDMATGTFLRFLRDSQASQAMMDARLLAVKEYFQYREDRKRRWRELWKFRGPGRRRS